MSTDVNGIQNEVGVTGAAQTSITGIQHEVGVTGVAQTGVTGMMLEVGILVGFVPAGAGPGVQGALEIQGVAQGSGIANLGPSAVGVN